jgi:hypothetical protein
MADLSRLSFNQMTAGKASLTEVVESCVKHGGSDRGATL